MIVARTETTPTPAPPQASTPPQPQQSPYVDKTWAAARPDRAKVVPTAVAAGAATTAAATIAGADPIVAVAAGAGVGAATAGAMLLKGEKVADSTALPAEWTVRDAADGVRVMTWNIRGASGSWGGQMRGTVRDDIVDAIQRLDPDVVVMQEVDRRSPRSSGRDLAQQLAKRADATDWSFAYRRLGKLGTEFGAYGHLVMTRNGFQIEDDAQGRDRTYSLPLVTRQGIQPISSQGKLTAEATAGVQRIADVSAIRSPDGDRFTMVGVHLSSGNPSLRDRQGRELGAAIDALRAGKEVAGLRRGSEPARDRDLSPTVILAGDFNGKPESMRTAMSLDPDARGLTDALSAAGVPLRDPRRVSFMFGYSLDHVFVSDDARVTAASVLHAPRGEWAEGIRRHWPQDHTSDHDLIVADVQLPPKQTAAAEQQLA